MNKFILLFTLFWIFISSDAYRLKRKNNYIGLTPPKNCNENEIWNPCGGCEKTCDDPNPACPRICAIGKCRCKPGFVRYLNDSCIPQNDCAPDRRRRQNYDLSKNIQDSSQNTVIRRFPYFHPGPVILNTPASTNTESK